MIGDGCCGVCVCLCVTCADIDPRHHHHHHSRCAASSPPTLREARQGAVARHSPPASLGIGARAGGRRAGGDGRAGRVRGQARAGRRGFGRRATGRKWWTSRRVVQQPIRLSGGRRSSHLENREAIQSGAGLLYDCNANQRASTTMASTSTSSSSSSVVKTAPLVASTKSRPARKQITSHRLEQIRLAADKSNQT